MYAFAMKPALLFFTAENKADYTIYTMKENGN
jgi:hypothetical protein